MMEHLNNFMQIDSNWQSFLNTCMYETFLVSTLAQARRKKQ